VNSIVPIRFDLYSIRSERDAEEGKEAASVIPPRLLLYDNAIRLKQTTDLFSPQSAAGHLYGRKGAAVKRRRR
jgi:hypothetical protein